MKTTTMSACLAMLMIVLLRMPVMAESPCDVGSTTGTFANFIPDDFVGEPITITQGGLLTSLAMVGQGTGSGVVMAIYRDSSGLPGELFAVSDPGVVTFGRFSLNVVDRLIPAGNYWIMANFNQSGGHTNYNIGGTNIYQSSHTFTLPMPHQLSGGSLLCCATFPFIAEITCCHVDSRITGNLGICHGGSTVLCTLDSLVFPPLTYQWSNGSTSHCDSISVPGTYSVIVSAPNGCTSSSSATVFEHAVPFISCQASSSCSNSSTGSASVTIDSIPKLFTIISPSFRQFEFLPAQFGPTFETVPLSGNIVYIPDMFGSFEGCSGYAPGSLAGKIALIDRGNCNFINKVSNAQIAGASAVIVVNNSPGLVTMIGLGLINIPSILISQSDGQIIKDFLTQGSTVNGHTLSFTFQWSNGETTSGITHLAPGTYTVTFTTSDGCTTSCSSTVGSIAAPVCSITAPSTICPGSSASMCAPLGLGTYIWNSGALTPCLSTNAPGDYTITITNANGCTSSCSHHLGLNPAPVPVITGPGSICPGSSAMLNAGSGFAVYLWSNGFTTQSIVVSSPGTYTVTVTDVNGCTGFATKSLIFNSVPLNPVITTNSGYTAMCNRYSLILDAGPGYTSYNWSTGATTQTIAVNYASTIMVTVTNAAGCSGVASITTSVLAGPPASPGLISGNADGLCQGSGQVYSIAPVATSVNYLWTVPPGATIVSGQGTTSITVNFGLVITGTVTVKAFNPCGYSAARSLSITGIPAAPASVNGPVTGACNLQNVLYSVNPVPGATSYTWVVPAGVGIASGQGTSSVLLNFLPAFQQGSISVKSNNGCGASSSTSLAIVSKPQAPVIINGPIGVCHFQQNSYSIAPVFGATNYIWSVPSQVTILSGQGTPSIVVSFANKAGTISVKASNSCGTSTTISLATYFICREVNGQDVEVDELIAYPNPTSDKLSVNLYSHTDCAAIFRLVDITGRLVITREAKLLEGENSISFELNDLAPGIYVLQVAMENAEAKSLRIVVQ